MLETLIALILPILAQVESNHNPNAIGDNGAAIGILQLQEIVVRDVNLIYKTNYKPSDRESKEKSFEIATLYLKHYGAKYKNCTVKTLARIYVSGPDGPRQKNSLPYWRKVSLEIKRQRSILISRD